MKNKQEILDWLEENRKTFTDISDSIWDYAELPWKEFKSSKLQADYLEQQGFEITWDIAGMNTAFTAEWGTGKPVLGFAGEYDALEGLSQKNQPVKEALQPGAPGHGCGHNLLGTAALAAAAALKPWMEKSGTPGTIRYYGCPAEEGGSGKAYMARAGAFDDLDVAFNFHPATFNYPQKAAAVGVNSLKFRFHGIAAHAGEAPHMGRSALDAVELTNVGVNYLREHVKDDVRIHYTITHGGDLPNTVPDEAEVWYYIRAHKPQDLQDVTDRVRKVVNGAAMMTETRMDEVFESATSAVLSNHYLADLQYEAMQFIGPIKLTEEEKAYARQIQNAYPPENIESYKTMLKEMKLPEEKSEELLQVIDDPLIGINLPSFDSQDIRTGSTDVGDLSWITPVSILRCACFTIGVAGHDWGSVATGRMSIGHKGMLHAAKIMALAAQDCLLDPQHISNARREHSQAAKTNPYHCPLPAEIHPPLFFNPARNR